MQEAPFGFCSCLDVFITAELQLLMEPLVHCIYSVWEDLELLVIYGVS